MTTTIEELPYTISSSQHIVCPLNESSEVLYISGLNDMCQGGIFNVDTGRTQDFECRYCGMDREGYVLCHVNDMTYIHGGREMGGDRLLCNHMLATSNSFQWKIIPTHSPSPPARFNHCGTTISESQFIIYGGILSDGKEASDMWIYDIETFIWTEITSSGMSTPLIGMSMAYLPQDRSIVITGKHKGQNKSPSCYIFNLSSLSWSLPSISDSDMNISFGSLLTICMDGATPQLESKVAIVKPSESPPSDLPISSESPLLKSTISQETSIIRYGGLGHDGSIIKGLYILSKDKQRWEPLQVMGDMPKRGIYNGKLSHIGKGRVILYGGMIGDGKKEDKAYLLRFGVPEKSKEDILPPDMNKVVFPNGDIYIGLLLNGLQHGQGKQIYIDGSLYEGEWKEGVYEGNGSYKSPNGVKYEGEWKDGNRHGKGKEIVEGEGIYNGDWKEGRKCGYGTYISKDNIHYEGEWKDNNYNGNGTLSDSNGYKYIGSWKDGRRCGNGIESKNTDYTYTGSFEDDLKHGLGSCIYNDGSKYEGEWRGGKRNGYGELRYGNNGSILCDVYKGKFVGDVPCGKGQMLYANGDSYDGMFKDGLRHGEGTCKYSNGQIYKGLWKRDRQYSK